MSEVYIRSQGKKRLFVLNNANGIVCVRDPREFIRSIYKDSEERQKAKYCLCQWEHGAEYILGEYESEERCIEILDEIQSVCGSYLYSEGSSGLIKGSSAFPPMAAEIPRVYQMPEK